MKLLYLSIKLISNILSKSDILKFLQTYYVDSLNLAYLKNPFKNCLKNFGFFLVYLLLFSFLVNLLRVFLLLFLQGVALQSNNFSS